MVSALPVSHGSGAYQYLKKEYNCVRKEEVEIWGLESIRLRYYKFDAFAFEQVTVALMPGANKPPVNPSPITHSTTITTTKW